MSKNNYKAYLNIHLEKDEKGKSENAIFEELKKTSKDLKLCLTTVHNGKKVLIENGEIKEKK